VAPKAPAKAQAKAPAKPAAKAKGEKRGNQGEGGGRKSGGKMVTTPNGSKKYQKPGGLAGTDFFNEPKGTSKKKAKVEAADKSNMTSQNEELMKLAAEQKDEIEALKLEVKLGETKRDSFQDKSVRHIEKLEDQIDSLKALVETLGSMIKQHNSNFTPALPREVSKPKWLTSAKEEVAEREEQDF
jgi:hypothetical protein